MHDHDEPPASARNPERGTGAAAGVALPGPGAGHPGPGDPGPGARGVIGPGDADAVRRSDLPGGARLVTETVPWVRSVAIGIWIGIGSVDETADQAGAAHYLEHLLFKGTARRTAAGIAEEMDAVGGELNAFTAKEHTCYYAHVLDDDVALAIDVLADVVTEAELAHTDVELERGVVLEEISMRDDDPEDLLGELFDETLFGEHPLGRPVIGSEDSIRGMSRDTLHEFWRGEYTTPRMVVAAAGNLDHDRVADLVARALAGAAERSRGLPAEPPRGLPAEPPRGLPDDRTGTTRWPAAGGVATTRGPVAGRAGGAGSTQLGGPRPVRASALALHTDDSEQAHLMLGVPGPSRHTPGRAALAVLNTALGGGLSSRLFQQVREQRGLAYQVYSSQVRYADAGSLAVYAGCAPERLGEVVAVVRDVLAGVASDGLTDAEVARAQGTLRGGMVLGLEDTASRMNRLGRSELDHGRQRSLSESLARIAAVTPSEVADLAADLLAQPLTAAVVGPYDEIDDLPAALHDLA